MAHTHYLRPLDNVQLVFSIKQQKPVTLDSGVSTTLEMESYLLQKGGSIGMVDTGQDMPIAAVHDESTLSMIKKFLDHMKKLET